MASGNKSNQDSPPGPRRTNRFIRLAQLRCAPFFPALFPLFEPDDPLFDLAAGMISITARRNPVGMPSAGEPCPGAASTVQNEPVSITCVFFGKSKKSWGFAARARDHAACHSCRNPVRDHQYRIIAAFLRLVQDPTRCRSRLPSWDYFADDTRA